VCVCEIYPKKSQFKSSSKAVDIQRWTQLESPSQTVRQALNIITVNRQLFSVDSTSL